MLIILMLYWVSSDVAKRSNDDFMRDEARNIELVLSNVNNINSPLLEKYIIENPLHSRKSFYSYYVNLRNNNNIIMQTPDSPKFTSDDLAINFLQLTTNDPKFIWINKDKKYLVMLSKHHNFIIEIILDTSSQATITHEYLFFIIISLIGLLLALLAGYFITRRGLAGLSVLTNTAQMITSGSLSQRIDPQLLPPEIRDLGMAFNQMLDRIENSFIRLKQMADDLSHELSTPLTNLLMQTELLLSTPYTETAYRDTLGSNLEELQKMALLIENILFLARADNTQLKIEKASINAEIEIKKIIEYYELLAEEKNIKIKISGNAKIRVQSVMFARLMSNIISNAIKYSKKDGKIDIVITTTQYDTVRIEIEDNGIGISQEHLPYIFNRFYRIENESTASYSGTGLGLAIAQSIVYLHNGLIQINSQKAIGTKVKIILPI